MGRGRPLPPPGTPLPPPERPSKFVPIAVPKRKPVNPLSWTQQQRDSGHESKEILTQVPASPASLRSVRSGDKPSDDNTSDSLLVVAAPAGDSEPTTPSSEQELPHQPPWAENPEERDMTQGPATAVREIEPGRQSKRRPPHRALSTSPEEDGPQLPSWIAAQEEEARTKSTFVDEDIGL